MKQSQTKRRLGRLAAASAAAGLLWAAGGCEVHSWMDPSVVGRWERTPVVLPILDQLDVIDEPSGEPAGLSQVQPEDLIPTVQEYVIGPGDLVTITVFELMVRGVESVQTRRVDELGMVRLPVVGPVKAEGQTPSQLEQTIARILERKDVLRDATVSVIVQEERNNTFSVIGESSNIIGTAVGTYTIVGRDFRLLNAMSLARGVPGSIKKLYVIRQAPVAPEIVPTPGLAPETPRPAAPGPAAPGLTPSEIQGLLQGVEPDAKPAPPAPPATQPGAGGPLFAPPPPALEKGLDKPTAPDAWVDVGGRLVRAPAPATPPAPAGPAPAETQPAVAQRIVEIPYDKLLEGDTRYNIVIRAGDVIRVPPPVIGNVYIGGSINRPGSFNLPGDRDLTLKQLIFSAGGPNAVGIPERTDLIRRIGKNQEVTVRVDLRAIFAGTQPDIFLKPNDTINVGTSFVATPLAVIRNGFRAAYGFGFVLDRNFSEEVFGVQQNP